MDLLQECNTLLDTITNTNSGLFSIRAAVMSLINVKDIKVYGVLDYLSSRHELSTLAVHIVEKMGKKEHHDVLRKIVSEPIETAMQEDCVAYAARVLADVGDESDVELLSGISIQFYNYNIEFLRIAIEAMKARLSWTC